MRPSTLFNTLIGTLPPAENSSPPPKITPATHTVAFIEKGHMIEYVLVGEEKKRVVALFFGPHEFVVHCHPRYSTLENLDKAVSNPFSHGNIMQMLRQFEESRTYYREFRRRYQEKVADRIHTLTTMTGPERFAHLRKHQPWVFKLAEPTDIASYLAISMEMFKALMKGVQRK